jgi:hypothetical protein
MKGLLSVLFAITFFNASAQIVTEPRTEEYATIRVIVSALTGSFVNVANVINPVVEMEGVVSELKDYVKDQAGAKFATVTDVLNYMNKFGYTLDGFNELPYVGGKSNEVVQFYIFKRKPKNKTK